MQDPIAEVRERPLAGLCGLLLDAQATASARSRGALLEIGWARIPEESRETSALSITAHVVAPPPGATVPPAVARITGLRSAEWERGIAPASAWERLVRDADRVGAPPVPVVVHFARFEEPFLRALHERHGAGAFPFSLVCTHAIACRLLPELPRRTLRALAGYFGAGVPPLHRSADHVAATAFVWRHLVPLLAERDGVVDLPSLREWLAQPSHRGPRRFPLARERRRELPDRPGVYRLLRAGGAVLYVGKAASLRARVGSHFHARAGERALEMLTQVREVSCSETATSLEAALLETDEIKRLAPPYNVALSAEGRAVYFATAGLDRVLGRPDADHPIGPLGSPAPLEALRALCVALAGRVGASAVVRGRAVGVESPWAPGPECFDAGLARFAREHGPLNSTRRIQRLGRLLWTRRRASDGPKAPDEPGAELPRAARPSWDAEGVSEALQETVLRATHAVRRARWLLRLSECSLAWAEPGSARRRLLVIEAGVVAERTDLDARGELPIPPGHKRTAAERRLAFDVATFDRLRVLTTELRRLAAAAASLDVRLGPHVRLSRRRLQAVLRWI